MAMYPILDPNGADVNHVRCDDNCGAAVTILYGSFLPDGWYELSNNPAATRFWQFVNRDHAREWARQSIQIGVR